MLDVAQELHLAYYDRVFISSIRNAPLCQKLVSFGDASGLILKALIIFGGVSAGFCLQRQKVLAKKKIAFG